MNELRLSSLEKRRLMGNLVTVFKYHLKGGYKEELIDYSLWLQGRTRQGTMVLNYSHRNLGLILVTILSI